MLPWWVSFVKYHPALCRCAVSLARLRALRRVKSIQPYLQNVYSLLDVGAGMGLISEQLMDFIPQVVALDIEDLNFSNSINLVLYNGWHMPFPDQEFDALLLLGVLHHTAHQRIILAEAHRVADRTIVMEDLYESSSQRWYINLVDQVLNLEWHPPQKRFRTDAEWKQLFQSAGFTLLATLYQKTFLGVHHGFYVLDNSVS